MSTQFFAHTSPHWKKTILRFYFGKRMLARA
jgi:hypothetical protein